MLEKIEKLKKELELKLGENRVRDINYTEADITTIVFYNGEFQINWLSGFKPFDQTQYIAIAAVRANTLLDIETIKNINTIAKIINDNGFIISNQR